MIGVGEPIDSATAPALCPECFMGKHGCWLPPCDCSCRQGRPTLSPEVLTACIDAAEDGIGDAHHDFGCGSPLNPGEVYGKAAALAVLKVIQGEIAQAHAEVARLAAQIRARAESLSHTIGAVQDRVHDLDIEGLSAYDIERVARVACLPWHEVLRARDDHAWRLQTENSRLRALLSRYIEHVYQCEGSDFLGHRFSFSDVTWTDDEWATLQECRDAIGGLS